MSLTDDLETLRRKGQLDMVVFRCTDALVAGIDAATVIGAAAAAVLTHGAMRDDEAASQLAERVIACMNDPEAA